MLFGDVIVTFAFALHSAKEPESLSSSNFDNKRLSVKEHVDPVTESCRCCCSRQP
jgi:hypothetical protein